MNDLMRQWLWMQAMEYALGIVIERPKQKLYPGDKFHEWKHIGFTTMRDNCFKVALETLGKDVAPQGTYSGHSHNYIGLDIEADHNGVTSKYKDTTVTIKWPEVRKFIEKLLTPEDRQLDLFEILAREAQK